MNTTLTAALLAGASVLAFAATAQAQNVAAFNWEGEIELGVDSLYESDVAGAELTDVYTSIELGAELAVSERVSVFGAVTIESVLDPAGDREFSDIGLYVSELGVSFDLDFATVSAGKVSPAFGTAWDITPGFYGTALAEDYELSEAIGLTADFPLGQSGGLLSMAVFYADDTVLSDSWGTRRGRNSTVAGGAGNTGEMNNVALQWSREFNNTLVSVGARQLRAGPGDVRDETGLVGGLSHQFDNGASVMAEVASFRGFGGTPDDATYGTLGGTYDIGDWTLAAAFTQRDITSTGVDRLYSVGADYGFRNGVELGLGLALVDAAGVTSRAADFSVTVPLGG